MPCSVLGATYTVENKTDISLALWKLLNVEDNVKQKNHQVNVVNNFGGYMRRKHRVL